MIRLLPEPTIVGADIGAVVASAGFTAERPVPAGPASPEQWSWVHPDGTAVTWVLDGIVGFAYVVVEGTHERQAAELVGARLTMVDWRAALVELQAAESWDVIVEAVYRLVLAAPAESVPPVAAAVTGLAAHEHPTVRQAAYVAIMYLGWPALMPLVRAAADDDPDPQNRALARSLVPTTG